MKRFKVAIVLTLAVGIVCLALFPVPAQAQKQSQQVVRETTSNRGLSWAPQVHYDGATLVVVGPEGKVYEQQFLGSESLNYYLIDMQGNSLPDGHYSYQLRLQKNMTRSAIKEGDLEGISLGDLSQMGIGGNFIIKDGSFIAGDEKDGPRDIVIQAINPFGNYFTGDGGFSGDLGLGVSDGFNPAQELHIQDTIPAIRWDDTVSGQIWDLEMNADYMRLYDVTAGGVITVSIAPGTASHTIATKGSVVGIGTPSPVDNANGTSRGALYIDSGINPALILNQSSAPIQKWEIFPSAADGALVFRDETAGQYRFMIDPNGDFGFGTTNPTYPMHVWRSGVNASMVVERSSGATNYINATSSYGNFGTVSNHPLRLVVNSLWKMRLNSDNSLSMASGASCTAGGTWVDASSRELKENIDSLTSEEALETLEELNPVKFNYKVDKEEKHVGFIAEEVPEIVASKDRKGMSPMDVVAILTKVVQKQQKTISELQERIAELEKKSNKK